MPDQLLQQKIYPYDGSQDSTKNPILIDAKDVIDSNNICYTTYSTKKLRPGIKPLLVAPQPMARHALAIIDFWRLGVQRIVKWDGQRITATDPSTGIIEDITGTAVLPIDEMATFCVFQGLLIICFYGGATPIKAWVGSGPIFDLSASAPNSPFAMVWLNSLWVSDPAIPGKLNKSNTGDPTDFLTGDATELLLDINDSDPEGITAIFPPFFNSLYVSKRLSIFQIEPTFLSEGFLVYKLTKISDGIGAVSHSAVVAAESQIFFCSDWGWHIFQSTNKIAGIDTDLLSRQIQPVWVNDTNFNRAKYMQSAYDRGLNSILCVFPAAAFNYPTNLWGYSLVAQKWYRWQDFNHTSLCRYTEVTTKRLRTLVGGADGRMGFLDESTKTDYGRRFSCFLQSGIISPAGAPDDQFSFNYIGPLFVPQIGGQFTISYKIDGRFIETKTYSMEDTSLGDELGVDFVTGVSVLGGIPEIKFNKTRMKGYGMLYQLFVEYQPAINEDDSIGFELLGVFVDVSPVTKGIGEKVA